MADVYLTTDTLHQKGLRVNKIIFYYITRLSTNYCHVLNELHPRRMSIFAEAEKRQAFNRFKSRVDVDSDGNVQEVSFYANHVTTLLSLTVRR